MSILKDRIRPLDPSSLQEFLKPDREADAEGENAGYMVLRGNGDGELLRVPLRDITSAHETATSDRPDAELDARGLGTGQ